MMKMLLSRGNTNDKGIFNVHLSGGSPWGFTLHGGREFNSKLCISKITPGGKADKSKGLQVGDEVVAINNMECSARAEAIEQVRCSRQSLNLTIKRENSKQNGMQGRADEYHPLPNLYKTALEVVVEPNDFYKTYAVDPMMYKRIALHSKDSGDTWVRNDDNELSASNEDLLERYRNQGGMAGSDEALDRGTKSNVANGRTSPQNQYKDAGIPAQNRQPLNSLHSRAKSWSEHRGHSFPENQLHKRTYTSPDHIQKVKIRSANISSSSSTFSSPEDDGRQQSRISPIKRSPISRQHHVSDINSTNNEDNWVERWLRNDYDKPSISPEENISVKDVRSKFEEDKDPNTATSPVQDKSNFSRSKSFSGRPSYGVIFGTTAVKSKDHSQITAFQAPLPPARYSSSDLLKDKTSQNLSSADSWQSSTISLPVEMESPRRVTTIREERNHPLEVRLSRKSLGSMSMVSSTSSLDSIGSYDARRQGPAPPPRRSESKLLSSFRFRGRRMHPHTVSSSRTREALKTYPRDEAPMHVSSKSWPSYHLGNERQTFPNKESNRKSWHSQEPAAEQSNQRKKAQGEVPAKTGQTGQKCSSSVVIRSIRTSSSSSTSEDVSSKPKINRSSSVELQPPVATFEAARPQSAQGRPQTVQQLQQEKPWSFQQEAKSLSDRIEDTQILQRLMKGNEVASNPPSVKSRIQNFEKSSSHPNLLEEADAQQLRPRSNHPKQRSWDQTYSQSGGRSPKNAALEAWPHGRVTSEGNRLHTSNEDVAIPKQREQDSVQKSSEAGSSPIIVTSTVKELEKSESPLRLMQLDRTRHELPDAQNERLPRSTNASEQSQKESNLVVEKITRTQSTSLQEKEIFMEEMFKRLEDDKKSDLSARKLDASNNNVIDQQSRHKVSTYSVGDDDVFSSSADEDSLPPPPPPLDLETSHDNLPLPTPPREVLVKESPLRAETITKDREGKIIEVTAVEHTIQKPETPRWSENFSQAGEGEKRLSYSDEKSDKDKNIDEKIKEQTSPHVKENEDEVLKNERKESFDEKEDAQTLKENNTKNEELRQENEKESQENFDFIKMENNSNFYENEYTSPERSTEISLDTSKSDYDHSTKSPPPPPLVITSTPTSNSPDAYEGDSPDNDQAGNTSPFSGSSLSTPSSSRPGSMMSPKLEALDREKALLIESMKKKIEDLKTQMNEISEEIIENEKLGEKVAALLEGKTTSSELSKYQRFTGELNKIVLLLLSLTQRMHRYENTLQELDMSEEADRQQRDILLDKIEHVKGQYQEACKIKEVNDKRGEVVSKFLENYLDEDQFADFQYYIDMKTQLALMHAEIRDKVKMGEERLNSLTSTSIDWNMLNLCNY